MNCPWHPQWFRHWLIWIGIGAACVAAAVLLVHAPTPSPATAPSATAASATAAPQPTVALLYVTHQKDGDSFVASDGREYRLGMVNAPELDEPCGREAREYSRRFLASGFTADAYSSDRYGRQVSEIFDRSGKSLNIALAKSGFGDDRYLNQFRYENPGLAHRLGVAFAEAKQRPCAKS